MQGLISVDIADSRQDLLVQEYGLNHSFGNAEAHQERLDIDLEGIRTDLTPESCLQLLKR